MKTLERGKHTPSLNGAMNIAGSELCEIYVMNLPKGMGEPYVMSPTVRQKILLQRYAWSQKKSFAEQFQTIRVNTISLLAKDFATKVCLKSQEDCCSTISNDPGEHNFVVGKRFCNKGMLEVRRRVLLNNFRRSGWTQFHCRQKILQQRYPWSQKSLAQQIQANIISFLYIENQCGPCSIWDHN